jgi:hypothetical protein
MKTLFLLPLSVLLLFCGASTPKGPAPVDAKKHDEVYKTMLNAYVAQANYYAVAMSNSQVGQLVEAHEAKDRAILAWQNMVLALQKESHAEGCNLGMDLAWTCPPPPAKK